VDPAGESIRVQLRRRKAKSGDSLTVTVEERLALFDANTKWLDELQAERLKEAKAKAARYYPRESWLDARGALRRSWFRSSTLTFWFTAATREIQPSARALAQYCVGGSRRGPAHRPPIPGRVCELRDRSRGTESPLMTREDATRQAELFMAEFPVLYPNQHVFRTALRGMAAYRLSWFEAASLGLRGALCDT